MSVRMKLRDPSWLRVVDEHLQRMPAGAAVRIDRYRAFSVGYVLRVVGFYLFVWLPLVLVALILSFGNNGAGDGAGDDGQGSREQESRRPCGLRISNAADTGPALDRHPLKDKVAKQRFFATLLACARQGRAVEVARSGQVQQQLAPLAGEAGVPAGCLIDTRPLPRGAAAVGALEERGFELRVDEGEVVLEKRSENLDRVGSAIGLALLVGLSVLVPWLFLVFIFVTGRDFPMTLWSLVKGSFVATRSVVRIRLTDEAFHFDDLSDDAWSRGVRVRRRDLRASFLADAGWSIPLAPVHLELLTEREALSLSASARKEAGAVESAMLGLLLTPWRELVHGCARRSVSEPEPHPASLAS